MIDSIPLNLRIAMGSGVGLFIGFIGLKSGGIIVSNNATLLGLGDFSSYETFLSALGFLLISVLAVRKSSRSNNYWSTRCYFSCPSIKFNRISRCLSIPTITCTNTDET
jgi:xanthine/uracil/vitamin C permease (AzgA family)